MGHDHKHGHGHHGGHGHAQETPAHGPSPAREHRSDAPTHVSCFVLTCSDSRGHADDVSGRALREALEAAGHSVVGQTVVQDEPEQIRAAVERGLEGGARAVLITGGTGITRRDQTVEAIRPLLEKEIPGFGELFRMLSFQGDRQRGLALAGAGGHGARDARLRPSREPERGPARAGPAHPPRAGARRPGAEPLGAATWVW